MSSLRWIERDGKMVLQSYVETRYFNGERTEVYADVPTHQEPKKVTLEQELADAIFQERVWNHPITCAKIAIEFFKKRMLPVMEVQYDAFGNRRESYHGDCHKALFGEE